MVEVEFAGRMEALRAERPEAVAWMFSTFREDVERCFWRRPLEDREDLVQEVFSIAIVRLHTFQGGHEASLRAWLRSIAFHRWHHRWEADQVRSRYAGPSLEALLEANPGHEALGEVGSDPQERVCQDLSVEALLSRLTPGQAQVVRAHVLDGLTTREIASNWGVPRERIRGLYKRAVAKLRSEGFARGLLEAA